MLDNGNLDIVALEASENKKVEKPGVACGKGQDFIEETR